jgi:hypothetical protein
MNAAWLKSRKGADEQRGKGDETFLWFARSPFLLFPLSPQLVFLTS